MRAITSSLGALALLGLLNPAMAQADRDSASLQEQQPTFLSTDVLMGCETKGPNARVDSVDDALVDASSGRITALIMSSGAITNFDRVHWNAEAKRLDFKAADTRGGKVVEASSPRTSPALAVGECFLLSSIMEYPIVGSERTDNGRTELDLGSAGGAFVDIRSGHVAYVTTSVGGMLGIGAESRVIPWAAVEVNHNAQGEYRLRTTLTEQRLERAPAFGSGPDNLDNPEYRDTLYSYYGVDRARFEPASRDKASLVTFDLVQGATILRGTDDKGALKDLIVASDSGEVTYALCENGDVLPIGALKWDAANKQFRVGSEVKGASIQVDERPILASALGDYTVMCGTEDIGALEEVYFDTNSGKFSYVAIDHDGVRVLPWSALSFAMQDDEPHIMVNRSMAALKAAPELDGKVGATIYSPAFRERVDAAKQ